MYFISQKVNPHQNDQTDIRIKNINRARVSSYENYVGKAVRKTLAGSNKK